MYTKTILAFAASAMSVASASPARPTTGPVPVFHVTNYETLCTDNTSQDCTTSFTIHLNSYPSVDCHVKSTSTDYDICGTIDPEQYYSAYIQKPDINGRKFLQVKFGSSFAGAPEHDVLGKTPLNHPTRDFDFAAYEST